MDQIIHEFLKGKLKGHIHKLRIHQDTSFLLEGFGSLVLNDDKLAIELCAPAPEGDNPRQLTGLVDRKHLIQFSGEFVGTPLRQPYQVKGIFGGGRRGHCSSADQRWWIHEVQEIEFEFDSIPFERCRFHGVVKPWLNYGFTASHAAIFDENSMFGEVVCHYQCLLFDFREFRIGIRDNSIQEIGEFVIEGPTEEGHFLRKLSDALLKATSLRWGYEMEWLTASHEVGRRECFKIFPEVLERTENHRWHKPPVVIGPFKDDTNERFLIKSLEFFLDHDDIDLFEYLRLFWRTGPTGSLELRESVIGAAIEGLATKIVDKRATKSQKQDIEQTKNSFHDCQKKVVSILERDVNLQADTHFESILLGIKAQTYQVAKRVLLLAAQIARFEVSEKELKSWGKLRNAAAHGRNVYVAIDDARMRDFETCVTLLNKFCMALIGYEGWYEDYADEEIPSKKFSLLEAV